MVLLLLFLLLKLLLMILLNILLLLLLLLILEVFIVLLKLLLMILLNILLLFYLFISIHSIFFILYSIVYYLFYLIIMVTFYLLVLSLIPSINLCSVAFSSISNNFKCGFYSIIIPSLRYRFNYWLILFHFLIFEQELILVRLIFLMNGLLLMSSYSSYYDLFDIV